MATTIKLKNSVTAAGSPSALAQGEVGINVTDKKVWVGNAATTPVQLLGAGASASFTTITTSSDASISGLTVGKGGGAIGTNTTVGANALTGNTTGGSNVGIGYQTLYSNTTASNNTAVGYQAGYSNSTGTQNAFFGRSAGYANTTGAYNSVFGDGAFDTNTTGNSNTVIGQDALQANTTASNNTAVGYQAGYSTTTSGGNTFLGRLSGYSTTGTDNIFVGVTSGYYVTTGAKNVILGAYNGNQGGLDIRTLNNCIVLSDGDGAPRFYETSNGKWNMNNETGGSQVLDIKNTTASNPYGMNITFTAAAPNDASKWFHLCEDTGGLRFVVNANGGIKNYQANDSNLSDIREKKNIELAGNYLNKICSIPVKTFLYNDQTDTDLNLGVIAQDVQAVCPELVTETNWGSEENSKMRLSIYETDLKYAMLKAIQELKAEVDSLKQQLGK